MPGVKEDVEELLADYSDSLNPDALYVIWAGANDVFLYLDLVGQTGDPSLFDWILTGAVQNIAKTLCTLSAAGARHFAVVNLPDIGLTPFGTSQGQPKASLLTLASTTFNEGLAAALDALPCADKVDTLVILDVFTFLGDVVDHPKDYGLKNVKAPCLTVLDDGSYKVCARPDRYLFWDEVHPTTAGHALVAQHFVTELCGCGMDHHHWWRHRDHWDRDQTPFWHDLCDGVR